MGKSLPGYVHAIPPILFLMAAPLLFYAVDSPAQVEPVYPLRAVGGLIGVLAGIVAALDIAVWYSGQLDRARRATRLHAASGRQLPPDLPRRKM